VADLVRIASDRLSAAIDPFGAELVSLRDADGAELMTDADPAYWAGHAPILFPVVGRLNEDVLRLDGCEYPMPKHGFARRSAFEVIAAEPDRAVFALVDSPATRLAYPFAFRLEIAFTVEDATLRTEATISNLGPDPLPASFGFHPAFAWPLPYGRARADHRIVFDEEESVRLAAITPDGLIAAGTTPSPLDGRTLPLADALFEHDALVWRELRSQALVYGASDGPHLRIAFPSTPMLGIWTKPGAAYVCVEPWHGIADPEGYTGDFRAKPGVFEVAPGASKSIGMSVTLVP
jgi:galactose mutarotase-like enzyme